MYVDIIDYIMHTNFPPQHDSLFLSTKGIKGLWLKAVQYGMVVHKIWDHKNFHWLDARRDKIKLTDILFL